jgi:hypothetical protein
MLVLQPGRLVERERGACSHADPQVSLKDRRREVHYRIVCASKRLAHRERALALSPPMRGLGGSEQGLALSWSLSVLDLHRVHCGLPVCR